MSSERKGLYQDTTEKLPLLGKSIADETQKDLKIPLSGIKCGLLLIYLIRFENN